jgi:proton-dependent oligopeptide transporter, POT family
MNLEKTSSKHPLGLSVLFTTEMWERFNFYGMRAILTLFLVNALAFSQDESSIIYGGFLGLCYLTPMLGGFLSDRYLGNRACITIGGLTMATGQLFLFGSASFYASNLDFAQNLVWIGLGCVIVGNGFFKPNISSMVGQIYPKGDSRLDSAFTIFYMGINLGAFLGMTICATLGDVKVDGIRDVSAFKWGFLAAGIAMIFGVMMFNFLKNKYIVSPEGLPVGQKPKVTKDSQNTEGAQFTQKSILTWVIIGLGLVIGFKFGLGQNWIYAFIYSSGITLGGLILSDKSLTSQEKDRIWAIYLVAFFVIFFWACFEQAGSSLTFIADKQTNLELFGFQIPPSLVQNANSFFIIVFAPIFSVLWMALQKRKVEPISPVKQALGLTFLALGYFLIALQVKDLGNGKLGVIWLFLMYMFHTLGEICLSPIGLSLVSKLAPLRFSSLLMGVWFLSNASGYALAGTLGTLMPPTGDKFEQAAKAGLDLQAILNKTIIPTFEQLAKLKALKINSEYPSFLGFQITSLYEFFMLFVALPGVAAILLFLLSGILKKLMHGIK